LTGGARESKIFSARWSFPLIPYHKACLSQMKLTQNTESKKQGKKVLGQQNSKLPSTEVLAPTMQLLKYEHIVDSLFNKR